MYSHMSALRGFSNSGQDFSFGEEVRRLDFAVSSALRPPARTNQRGKRPNCRPDLPSAQQNRAHLNLYIAWLSRACAIAFDANHQTSAAVSETAAAIAIAVCMPRSN